MTGGSMPARGPSDRVHLELIASARRHWSSLAVADSTGQRLTYGRMLVVGFALARALARLTAGQTNVATLLPASVGAAVANLALLLAGKVPVNLNFTAGPDALETCIRQADIRTILTSRRFLEKAGLPAHPSMVYLEDVRERIGLSDKLAALAQARLAPLGWLRRRLSGPPSASSPLFTIMFSSGSTGVPKGVMLSHANVLANVDSLSTIFPMTTRDVFVGILPLFHSFGFTGTFWFPLLQGAGVVYHPNPVDAKTIGELAETYKATMLISTPTFCGTYLRRCTPEQFATLRHAIVGAEKLREPLATEFREKFGIGLLEGYGMTEMSPVVAVNLPDEDTPAGRRVRTRPGSVGRPIPGVDAKVVDRETGEDLPVGREGLLLVRGASLMMGYLGEPDRTAEVLRDGWYATGDIGRLDEDGFLFITDRVSRFSKIGGEMVPHVSVEDAINRILGDASAVVTAVPDATRGERLVAFYAKPDVPPDVLWHRLAETDLPKLWVPKRENLVPIDAIPTLGTGKADLRRIKQLAMARG
ncbi:MAG: AMP-binding protein [Acidobacteria bacterium]|nr:AMP-binding protein [Acidobacteriota bacterium]